MSVLGPILFVVHTDELGQVSAKRGSLFISSTTVSCTWTVWYLSDTSETVAVSSSLAWARAGNIYSKPDQYTGFVAGLQRAGRQDIAISGLLGASFVFSRWHSMRPGSGGDRQSPDYGNTSLWHLLCHLLPATTAHTSDVHYSHESKGVSMVFWRC